ncbi:hypothetical protein [Klebsiella sp. GG_Kp170]|uniref:hypothetical protein n=1 Tax=Klebsiella sp. GG_Kp170 TaxID=3153481 RepID=UPI0032B50BA5
MTKSTITRERAQQIFLGNGPEPSASEERELARMALAAMDSEPVAWTWHYREQWHVTNDERRAEFVAKDGDVAVLPLYRHAQPAPVVEREPIAWLNDAYLARGVVDGEAGSEDAGPGYIPVYREAGPQPAPEMKPVGYLFVSEQGAIAYSPTNWGIPGFRLIGQIYGDMSVELPAAPQEVKGE